MAKATPQSYQVTNLSDITYNGKVAPMGSVVSDLPGEDISWLLSDGFIVSAPSQPDTSAPADPAPTDTPAPADPSTTGGSN